MQTSVGDYGGPKDLYRGKVLQIKKALGFWCNIKGSEALEVHSTSGSSRNLLEG